MNTMRGLRATAVAGSKQSTCSFIGVPLGTPLFVARHNPHRKARQGALQSEVAAVPKAPARKSPAPRRAEPQASAPDEAAVRVLRQFRQVFNAVKTHFRQVEKWAGIGGAQLWALSLIRDHPGITVTALAGAMDVHQSTASNLVKALLTQGLIEIRRNGVDRRSALLEISTSGVRLIRRAPGPLAGVLPEALGRLDRSTLDRLDADLSTLLTVLDADKRAAKIPLAHL